MGQESCSLPNTWEGLLDEKNRVVHWSGEVLLKITDSVRFENPFVTELNDQKINSKIDSWLQKYQAQMNEILMKYPDTSPSKRAQLTSKLEQLKEEYQKKMKKNYENAYADLKKIDKQVENLEAKQRKIQQDIQLLFDTYLGDMKRFQKKLEPLRTRTFDNLQITEKLISQGRILKNEFAKRVYDIDHKNADEYAKKVSKVLKDFEKSVLKR